MKPIYLDHNATTPLDDAVFGAMSPFFREHFGNPAGLHVFSRMARDAVELARCSVADLIGGRKGKIIFTASATEANNQLLASWIETAEKPCHLITTTIEHKSVSSPLRYAEQNDRVTVTRLKPDAFGRIEPATLAEALRPETGFVSIMAANHVIHTLNPLRELAEMCAGRGILFHTDATQWVGKLPIDADDLKIDALTCSSHKFYGPKGAAALYLGPRGLQAGSIPLLRGGNQEGGLRAGTLNVPAIVGFGKAAQLASQRQIDDADRLRNLAERLFEGLQKEVPEIVLNGHPADRLPGGLHITLPGVDAKGLMAAVPHVAFSDGAACDAEDDPDYVVKAIGKPEAAHCSIRLQVGHTTSESDIQTALIYLLQGICAMKAFAY